MFAAISQEGTQYGIAPIVWISLNRWESGNRPMAEYLTVKELSQYIKRSPGAIRNLVMRRVIPYREPGNRIFFSRAEIDNWIESAEGTRLAEIVEDPS